MVRSLLPPFDPMNRLVTPEPGLLAFCIAPAVALDQFDCLATRMQSVEKTEPLLITDRLQGIQVTERIEPEASCSSPASTIKLTRRLMRS